MLPKKKKKLLDRIKQMDASKREKVKQLLKRRKQLENN